MIQPICIRINRRNIQSSNIDRVSFIRFHKGRSIKILVISAVSTGTLSQSPTYCENSTRFRPNESGSHYFVKKPTEIPCGLYKCIARFKQVCAEPQPCCPPQHLQFRARVRHLRCAPAGPRIGWFESRRQPKVFSDLDREQSPGSQRASHPATKTGKGWLNGESQQSKPPPTGFRCA